MNPLGRSWTTLEQMRRTHRNAFGRQDKKVSFMRSYPDLIPLDAGAVQRTAEVLERWPFDPIYGAWWERVIASGGKRAIAYSARRYIDAITRSRPK